MVTALINCMFDCTLQEWEPKMLTPVTNEEIATSGRYESLSDLQNLQRVFHATTSALREFADTEFDNPSALYLQDELLAQRQSLLKSASKIRGTGIQSVLMKFELWLEDYSTCSADVSSAEGGAILESIHQDLVFLAG